MTPRCCQDTELVHTECGRQFSVCVNCDNGVNDCTEGLCDHREATRAAMSPREVATLSARLWATQQRVDALRVELQEAEADADEAYRAFRAMSRNGLDVGYRLV